MVTGVGIRSRGNIFNHFAFGITFTGYYVKPGVNKRLKVILLTDDFNLYFMLKCAFQIKIRKKYLPNVDLRSNKV